MLPRPRYVHCLTTTSRERCNSCQGPDQTGSTSQQPTPSACHTLIIFSPSFPSNQWADERGAMAEACLSVYLVRLVRLVRLMIPRSAFYRPLVATSFGRPDTKVGQQLSGSMQMRARHATRVFALRIDAWVWYRQPVAPRPRGRGGQWYAMVNGDAFIENAKLAAVLSWRAMLLRGACARGLCTICTSTAGREPNSEVPMCEHGSECRFIAHLAQEVLLDIMIVHDLPRARDFSVAPPSHASHASLARLARLANLANLCKPRALSVLTSSSDESDVGETLLQTTSRQPAHSIWRRRQHMAAIGNYRSLVCYTADG
jgi:hypothetical protein